HGDFKLAAAAGAWLGATQIPWLLLLASAMGSAWGLWRATRGHAASQPFAFGPFLALATFVLLVFGHQ
ncbi:MAG: prepilin peptidase, partial [Proteobacteria bacterium]|nr:prepilin peptidase [Pseudomonadota bacterium]